MALAGVISKKIVLCIDNDRAVLGYEKALLERAGYAPVLATSAQQGLRLISMLKCDVVILEYDLPRMNGHEVAFRIKRLIPQQQIVLISGSDVPIHVLALVDAFVFKLDVSRELLPMIAALCSRTHAHRPKRGYVRPRMAHNLAASYPDGFFDYIQPAARPARTWEEDS